MRRHSRRARTDVSQRDTTPPHRIALLLLTLSGLAAFLTLPLLSAGTANADNRPPGGRLSDPVVRAVDIAEPAIVRLATIYNAHITFTLCGQYITLPASGAGYLTGGTGSGAFISATGDVLTADHVVNIDKADLDQEIFQDTQSSQDIANMLNTNASCLLSQPVTADQVAAGFVQYVGIPYTTHYSQPQRLVWQNTGYTGATSSASNQSLIDGLLSVDHQEATVVASSPFTENDLAVVHVGLTDTPSIQLDNSTTVAVQDQLTIIGFPGNGDVSNDATDLLTPSINSIAVSAIKTGDNGAPLIQVGGNVEHGDSGGPALDADGHIVGIVSFGGPDTRGITAFLRSSNSAQALFADGGISTRPGAFETAWQQAFTDYSATYPGHWHTAARELNALSTRYPSFRAVQAYRDYANSAAQAETVSTRPTQTVIMLALSGAGLVTVIALILTIVFVARRNARNARRAAFAASQKTYYSASNPYGPPTAGAGAYGPYGPYGGYGPPSTYPGYGPPSASYPPAGPVGVSAPYQAPTSPASESAFTHTGGVATQTPAARSDPSDGAAPSYGRMPEAGATSQRPAAGGDATRRDAAPTTDGPDVSWSGQRPSQGFVYVWCANGHQMRSSEIYCALCGAPRLSDYPPQAQS